MSNIIDNLKTYTEINQISKFEFQQFHVTTFYKSIKKDFNLDTFENEIELVTKNKTDQEQLCFSWYALCLVAFNFVSNAIKHNKGQVTKIELCLRKEPTGFILSVCDDGEGIGKDFQKLIFEPFKTISNKNYTRSSGLGLAICKQIAEMTNSEVWLTSKPGIGSTFYFKFNG